MRNPNVLKRAAAAAAVAVMGAAAALSGAGAAAADSVGPVSGSSDAVNFTRTVSGVKLVNGAIPNGEVVTVSNKLNRKLAWLIYYVKDTHPTCMKAVPNTSVWKVSGKTYTNNPSGEGTYKGSEFTSGPGWAQIKPAAANSWESIEWSQDYLLTCATGPLNTGGLQWSSTWAGESGNNKPNVGPTINVTPGVASVSATPQDAMAKNDVMLTVKNPDGLPGDKVTLTSKGKTLDGCGNLELDENRIVTCIWVPKRKGDYPLKAVIASQPPVTVTGSVYVSPAPVSGSMSGGSLDGSLGGGDSGSLSSGSLGDLIG
ncbi:MAG: hypothetical protein WBA05_01610 [Gordonia sp. (in: high G+C Gram-positive bacteria)]|uniref:hypothetical protein n=1 Tax=Gordonia TaxID=2053 RepID=UPI003267AD78